MSVIFCPQRDHPQTRLWVRDDLHFRLCRTMRGDKTLKGGCFVKYKYKDIQR